MYPRPEGYTPPNERSLGRKGTYLNAVFVGIVSSVAAWVCAWLFAFGGLGTVADTVKSVELSRGPPWLTVKSREQKVAESAVLTLADLPPGWTLAADDDDEDDDDVDVDLEISEECKQVEGLERFAGSLASSESEDMEGPDRQSVSSKANVFAGGEEAQSALETQRRGFSQCGTDFAAVINAMFQGALEEKGVSPEMVEVQTALEDLGSPTVGESALMFRLRSIVTGPRGSIEFALDFITFRHGRMVGELFYSTFGGLRPEEQQQLAQIAATKLQIANASLPER